jgi:hypothetical protein
LFKQITFPATLVVPRLGDNPFSANEFGHLIRWPASRDVKGTEPRIAALSTTRAILSMTIRQTAAVEYSFDATATHEPMGPDLDIIFPPYLQDPNHLVTLMTLIE